MSKAETLDAILEQAIHHFADWGFEGASLRAIAAAAGVPLSAIHVYYGTKRQLYDVALYHVWDEIARERDASIQQTLRDHPGRSATLEEILTAIVLPVVRRSMSDDKSARARLALMRSRLREREALDGDVTNAAVDRQTLAWITATANALPGISRHDAIWLFSYIGGVMYSMQVFDRRYDRMLVGDVERTVESITQDIVDFCRGGAEAMVRRRARDAAPD